MSKFYGLAGRREADELIDYLTEDGIYVTVNVSLEDSGNITANVVPNL